VAALKIMVKNLKINHILVCQKSFLKLRSHESPIAGSGSTKALPKKAYRYDENTSFNVNVSNKKFKSNTSFEKNDRYSRN